MANPAHLEKLCEGPKAWNDWRDANPNIVPDLSKIQLTLHQRQFGPSNGGPIDLNAADLDHAVLRYATLSGADLQGSRLIGADLTHARLDGAKLSGADLTEAVLDQADLTGAILDQAVLFGANLSDTRNLTITQLEQAFGDTSTKLPSSLMAPANWFPHSDEPDEDDYAGWGMASYEEPVEQSLYEILGLTPKAESEQIRTAYRILVKKLHPDLNPNDEAAQDRFKQVTTAYRILNDAQQRARYDREEIDGEGRVNPDFEARRQFRRAAFRYYGIAASSLVLATGLLFGVWYTVLSLQPDEDPAPQVAMTTPPQKKSERLGERLKQAPVKVARPTMDEVRAPAPDASAPDEVTPMTQPDAPLAADGEASPENSAADAPGSDANGAPDQTLQTAAKIEEPQPSADDADATPAVSADVPPAPQAPAGGNASPTPPASPASRTPGQVAQALQTTMAEIRQLTAPTLPLMQKGTAQRPLREAHNSSAGQNKPSAPDNGSVAALPSSAEQTWIAANAGNAPAGAGGAQRFPFAALSRWTQRATGQDVVSQLLRSRALRQAFGDGKRPSAASGGVAPSGRRVVGPNPDVPTNAVPGKVAGAPIKPTAASVQRKRNENRTSANAAAANKAPVTQAPKRDFRQQQAVTDPSFPGGL